MGDDGAGVCVYIANTPNFADYASLDSVKPIQPGEIDAIGQHCGNGWRKVFNVYAKLLFALGDTPWYSLVGCESWQAYRDEHLLQDRSGTALLFSAPDLTLPDRCHIVMGKHYGLSLNLPWYWLDARFAIVPGHNIVLCPYFDYRQLTNAHIAQLAVLLRKWASNHADSV